MFNIATNIFYNIYYIMYKEIIILLIIILVIDLPVILLLNKDMYQIQFRKINNSKINITNNKKCKIVKVKCTQKKYS